MPHIIAHDELIAAHWGDCDVQAGETPEAYAIRHEEMRSPVVMAWDLGLRSGCAVICVQRRNGSLEVRQIHPSTFFSW